MENVAKEGTVESIKVNSEWKTGYLKIHCFKHFYFSYVCLKGTGIYVCYNFSIYAYTVKTTSAKALSV